MKAVIKKKALSGTVTAPPSKSAAHRAIIASALADGKSVIGNVSLSEDIKATAQAVEKLCADVEYSDKSLTVYGKKNKEAEELFANESGSTLRFLIPLCLDKKERVIKGAKRLFDRPLGVYEDIFEKEGISYEKGEGFIRINGMLRGGEYKIPGDISSQFITGLLFALPLAENDSKITVTGEFESKPYVMMTLDVLKKFGISIQSSGNEFFIKKCQCYKPTNMTVEGDWSNAAFFEALNYFGSEVTVTGLSNDSLQGDKVCTELFDKIKAGGAEISIKDCPDLAPILFTVAAETGGAYFYDTKRLKLKESDRASAMAKELSKMGIKVKVDENSVTVEGKMKSPEEILSSHNDHRIAMALSAALTKYGGIIEGAEAVKKSMPDFYEKLLMLGAEAVFYDA